MAKSVGNAAPDGSKYVASTDGAGSLVTITSTSTGTTKKVGMIAPDGSTYATLSNGAGTLQ